MRIKRQFSKFLFGGVLLVAIGVAAFGFSTFQHNLEAMRQASQENISWSAAQLERELARFRDSLGASSAGQSSSTAEINQRFDVLWSRVAIFQRGTVGARLREYDREQNVIGRLFEEMKRQEVEVVSISSFDFTTLANISRAFAPFEQELYALSRRVTLGEEEKAAIVRERLREGALFALYASILTVVLVLAAMGYFVLEGRRYRKLADENMVLAEQFKTASAVKSRFLTMMSHELRTPMNGVLGLLAVAREAPRDQEQKELLDQADRAANRMLGMLTDILDFAALENAQFALDDKPFFTRELLLALPELLGPVAMQAEARLHVDAAGNLPLMLCGDATRLRRSYALMVTYFLETAGARDIALKLSYENGHLLARIEVDYLDGGWSPDLIFGKRDSSADSFAADVLGPTVARVLVDKMAGEIRQVETVDGKIVLEIDVPVREMETRRLKLLLDMQSAPMEMICKSALSGFSVAYIDRDTPQEAEIVLMESGTANEQEKVAQMRKASPGALIFGIGRPRAPKDFDFVAEVPLEAAQLKNRIAEVMG